MNNLLRAYNLQRNDIKYILFLEDLLTRTLKKIYIYSY